MVMGNDENNVEELTDTDEPASTSIEETKNGTGTQGIFTRTLDTGEFGEKFNLDPTEDIKGSREANNVANNNDILIGWDGDSQLPDDASEKKGLFDKITNFLPGKNKKSSIPSLPFEELMRKYRSYAPKLFSLSDEENKFSCTFVEEDDKTKQRTVLIEFDENCAQAISCGAIERLLKASSDGKNVGQIKIKALGKSDSETNKPSLGIDATIAIGQNGVPSAISIDKESAPIFVGIKNKDFEIIISVIAGNEATISKISGDIPRGHPCLKMAFSTDSDNKITLKDLIEKHQTLSRDDNSTVNDEHRSSQDNPSELIRRNHDIIREESEQSTQGAGGSVDDEAGSTLTDSTSVPINSTDQSRKH